MATVRTTPTRHDADADAKGKNKKRKRSTPKTKTRAQRTASSSSSVSLSNTNSSGVSPHVGVAGNSNGFVDNMVRRKLDAHSKWQLCTQKNLSEIRAECMKVRRELEKVEQIADNAVMQVQDEAADFRNVQEHVEKQAQATVQYVEMIQRNVEKTSTAMQTEMQNMKKKVRNIDQRVQQQATQSIDEDFLMTQLTELQERYDTELNKHKEEYLAKFQDKQQALDALKTQIYQINQAGRQEREDANRAAVVLDTDVKSLQHHMHELERERQASADIHSRLKIDINELGHRFGGFDRKLEDMVLKQQQLQQEQQQQQQQQQIPVWHPPPHHPHPFPIEDPTTKEKLHLLGQDVHLISEDVRRFTLRFDARLEEAHQTFTNQLRDLGSELFAALDHDSRQHVVENKRVREIIFDLQGTFRDGMGQMEERMRRMDENVRRMDKNARRVEESLRQLAMERRSRSPPRRPIDAFQSRSSLRSYEARPMSDEFSSRAVPPSFVGPIAAPRRSRSRSRSNPSDRIPRPSASRSPHRSECQTESVSRQESTISALDSCYSEPDRRQSPLHQSSPVANPVQNTDLQMEEVSDSGRGNRVSEREQGREERERTISTQEEHQHHRPQPPIRRSKKPRRTHEVIVIEDDDSADEMIVPPYRAPPDVVAEDYDTRHRTVVVHEQGVVSPANDGSSSSSSSSDRLRKLSDIQLGSLLYFCFGGAPSLDLEWTRYFSKLDSGDCIEMSRATNFLHRYPGLHSFPIYLAQFIVQAIVVKVPTGGTQSVALGFGFDDDTLVDKVDPDLIKDQFHKILDKIRFSWAETLVVKLQKMLKVAQERDSVDSDAQLSVNPALGETTGGTKLSTSSWLQQQAKSMWFLLRRHRFGSTMPSFTGDMVASPGVYVFLLMFDPVQVNRLTPQSGTFRLTNWGRALAIQLWDHLLSKLPYLLFADCSWLENQTDSSGKLPPLGFCHMLSAILASNSLTDKTLESSADFYSELVRLFLDCLHVNGVRVRDNEDLVSVTMNDTTGAASAMEIELIGVNTKVVSLLQLDGFFEVAHAIYSSQSARIALALAAAPGNWVQITTVNEQ